MDQLKKISSAVEIFPARWKYFHRGENIFEHKSSCTPTKAKTFKMYRQKLNDYFAFLLILYKNLHSNRIHEMCHCVGLLYQPNCSFSPNLHHSSLSMPVQCLSIGAFNATAHMTRQSIDAYICLIEGLQWTLLQLQLMNYKRVFRVR